eukprot:CAMPEP_0118959144 /NCGR_PEP_ID=MMETSP1169-20130426/62979_1 /TAXON_ID=36882 /ORGANISM="Pyramimonas obovata, Strain CCMP722" /LENGTH=294 /DNA_ID=CAMNT_0006907271 /DNA_START=178 /DNA_END=1062 /DNA_ORIENTATION=-
MGKSSALDSRELAQSGRWTDDGLGWDSIQECECGVGAKFCVCEGMECQRVPELAQEAAKPDTREAGGMGSTLRHTGGHDAVGYQGPASSSDDMIPVFGASSEKIDVAAGVSSRLSRMHVGGTDISPARARDIASTKTCHSSALDSNDDLDISLPSSLSYSSLHILAQNLPTPDTSEDSSGRSWSNSNDTSNTNFSDDELSSRREPMKERKRMMHRRSLSRWYNGKSKSFTSLADCYSLSSVQGLRKPENAGSKRKHSKNLEDYAKSLQAAVSLQASYSLGSFEDAYSCGRTIVE